MARSFLLQGPKAYADGADHIVIEHGNTEWGFDFACAYALYRDLGSALRHAEIMAELEDEE